MHWIQLNLTASERKAWFCIEQSKTDVHLLAFEYRIQTPFAGHIEHCPMKGTQLLSSYAFS